MSSDRYTYRHGERLPVEVLVFSMDPRVVDEFLRVDHEVWTVGEAFLEGFDRIPFVSKEVWLDDTRPGEVTIVLVWESIDAWKRVDAVDIQRRLQTSFESRFSSVVTRVRAPHEESNFGIHRWSRFERTEM